MARSRLPLHALGVLALGLLLLLLHAPEFRLERMHGNQLNDQVGYITTTRAWLDTGKLSSHLIYPAFVEQETFRFYMPGHYALLALAYLIGGDQPLVWRMPCMLSYLVVGVGAFLMGNRLYGRRAGWIAAVLVLGLPGAIGLAFTAMSEPTITAACTVVTTIFVLLPPRRRPWAMPLLLAVPFLFRETTALLLLPMVALLLTGAGAKRSGEGRPAERRTIVVSVLATLVVLASLYAWQVATGKWTPPARSWEGNDPGYASITAVALKSEIPSLPERLKAIGLNLLANTEQVSENISNLIATLWEPSNALFVLFLHVGALTYGWRRRPRDLFAIGTAGTGIAALLVFLAFHHAGTAHVLLRHVFWTHPLAAVVAGAWLSRLWEARTTRVPSRSLRTGVATLLGAALLVAHVLGVRQVARTVTERRPSGWTKLLESLDHDDGKMLVADPAISMDYVLHHYPVRWSFVPEDYATLKMLDRRFEVGTVVARQSLLRQGLRLTGDALAREGYEIVDNLKIHGRVYLVFRKAQGDEEAE